MYYDTRLNKKQTETNIARRGLDNPEINLAQIGIIDLVETHAIDTDLYTVTDTGEVEIRGGKAYVIYNKAPKVDAPDIRQTMKEKVHARRDAILAAGITFTFDGGDHKLQTRDAGELLAWDKTRTKAEKLSAETTIKVRTEADKSLFIPAGKLVVLLDHMEDYRIEVMDASWAIKDAIDDAATDPEAFTAYESGIDTVWPDNRPKQL